LSRYRAERRDYLALSGQKLGRAPSDTAVSAVRSPRSGGRPPRAGPLAAGRFCARTASRRRNARKTSRECGPQHCPFRPVQRTAAFRPRSPIVLGRGADAHGLHAEDVPGGHGCREPRVLAHAFEVAAAQRGAVKVDGGAQNGVHALAARFLSQDLAVTARRFDAPGGGRADDDGSEMESWRSSKSSPRTPDGPSDITTRLSPMSGMERVTQTSAPVSSWIRCSSVRLCASSRIRDSASGREALVGSGNAAGFVDREVAVDWSITPVGCRRGRIRGIFVNALDGHTASWQKSTLRWVLTMMLAIKPSLTRLWRKPSEIH
jgi:hypothetical protein